MNRDLRPIPNVKSFRRLPCGGSITTDGFDRQVFRVVRELSGDKTLVIVLLHPPAKGHGDIDLCVAYTKVRGFGRLVVLYLFPYRASDMNDIRKHRVPWGEGPENRRLQACEIHTAINGGGLVIAAWGEDGSHQNADSDFLRRYDGSPTCGSPYPSVVYPIEILGREAIAA